jgi:hypothetical protein
MPMPLSRLDKSYIVPADDITTGKGGATQLRKPQKKEVFPSSSCIKKATLWVSKDRTQGIVTIYFLKETSGYSVYEYHGTAKQTSDDFQLLVSSKEQNNSVGNTYIEVFKKGQYPPAIGIV